MASSKRSSKSSSAHSSPTTVSSFGVSETLQTPPSSPSSRTPAMFSNDRRTSSLRASVFDVFAELGAFDNGSQIAEWIFNPDVNDSSVVDASVEPRKGNVHFLEKSGSRFRERLNSDASMNLLKAYTGVTKASPNTSSSSASPVPTRRPTRKFFNGLRARSISRNRDSRRRKLVEPVSEEISISPPKKRPFLPFRSKSAQTTPTPPSRLSSSSLDLHRSGSTPVAPTFGHTSTPSIGTNASWVNIQRSASIDLLRSDNNALTNALLQGKSASRPGIPFPQEKERSVFRKISMAVGRPFSPSPDMGSISRSTLPLRRTQSRPPETTETMVAPLRTNFAMSFSTPQAINPTSRALTTMELL